jgi:phosphatidate cytidylyltransferase
MKTRAITGFFFVIVMLASVLTGAYTFTIFFLVLSVLCLNEFYTLVKSSDQIKPHKEWGILLAFSLFLPYCFHVLWGTPLSALLLAIPVVLLIYIYELFCHNPSPFNNLSYTFLGIIYSVLPFCFFYALAFRDGDFNFHYPLGFLLLLWASDTGAYLFGVKFGKNKLFERHSPKKSWEGFFGGMFISLVVSFLLSIFFNELSILNWASIALIVIVFGTIGDLTESMLKRSINVKDSGTMLPGHGGFLDRFDGLLFAAPMVFVYLYLVSLY